MPGEVEQQEIEEAEGTDADFAAGLGTTPTTTPEPTPEPSPEPSATPTPTPEPKYAQITEEELNELRTRSALVDEIRTTSKTNFDKAFGKLGALEDLVKKRQAETPAGESVEITDEDFKELTDMYPDLSAVQVPMLKKLLGKVKGTADPDAIDKLVAPRVEKVREEVRAEFLAITFPGWKDDVKTQDFADWRKTQGPDVDALAASDDYADAAKLLRMFYARAKTAAAQPTAAPTAKPVSTRTRQIAAGIPLKGDGGNPPGPSEEDDFNAGLKYRER